MWWHDYTPPVFSIDASNLRQCSDFRAGFVFHCIPQANTGAPKFGGGAGLAGRLSNFLGSDVRQDTVKVRYNWGGGESGNNNFTRNRPNPGIVVYIQQMLQQVGLITVKRSPLMKNG